MPPLGDVIDSIVNCSIFFKPISNADIELRFRSDECADLFLIVLADFLSPPGALLHTPIEKHENYLTLLRQALNRHKFTGDTTLLAASLSSFSVWLDGDAVAENLWLPSVEYNDKMRVKRIAYLKICGNTSKHGFTRLDQTSKEIKRIMEDSGAEIDIGQSYLLIPEFRAWFRKDVFVASSTLIAWHLNEIRWGLYEYLLTEYRRSHVETGITSGATMYRFDVPGEITAPLVRAIYWDLMNKVRSRPYFPRFSVHPYYRNVYCDS